MLKQTLLLMIVLVSFMTTLGFAQEDRTLLLEDLIEEALVNNPQLKAFYNASKAESSKIPQAGSLPDPVISFNLMNLPLDNFVFDQEPMSGKQLGIMQKLPFPGKLGLQERVTEKGADVSVATYQELHNQLVRNVKVLYYDLYFVDQSINTTQKNQGLLKEFVEVAETKYSVGKGLQQDVLKAQVEQSRMTERLINLKQKREELEARFNTLLNRPVTQAIGLISEPAENLSLFDRDQLEQTIANRRPLLRAWQSKIAQSKDKVSLAKRNYWPDFTLSLAYTQRDELQSGMGGVDFLSGGISLNVPLYFWRKQSKAVEENTIRQKQVEESYQNVHNQVLAELDNTLTDLDKNAELLELYRTGIIPQAAQSLESAMIGYQTDKVDFLTLINNQMTLFNLELEYSRILSNYQKNLAQLEFVAGDRLTDNI